MERTVMVVTFGFLSAATWLHTRFVIKRKYVDEVWPVEFTTEVMLNAGISQDVHIVTEK